MQARRPAPQWPCLLAIHLGIFALACTVQADEFDWLAPPGWYDSVSSNWVAVDPSTPWIIRAQGQGEGQGITGGPTQTRATERSPGWLWVTDELPLSLLPTAGPGTTAAPAPGASSAVPANPTSIPQELSIPQDFSNQQPPELGSVLQNSDNVQTVQFQQRSLLSREPYVRGFLDGQVYTLSDGIFMAPIRPDLDSMINRIDPSLFQDVSIIAGPYGLRYGPAFSFIAVETVDTPRYYNGYESHYRTGVSTQTNGGQLYGRQTVFGGSSDWGYIVHYGNRVGGDYSPGGNSVQPPVPASYKSQTFLAQMGMDLTEDSRLEFRYRRLDDTDTQYALQFFDVDFMGADVASLSYVWDDPTGDGSLSAMGWYNRSKFDGDIDPQSPAPYNTLDRVEESLDAFTGGTNVFEPTTRTFGKYEVEGARLNRTWGNRDETQLSSGVDFRHVSQRLTEEFDFTPASIARDFTTKLPRSYMVDPGAYSELSVSWLPGVISTVGGRVDWATTTTRFSDRRTWPLSNLEIYADRLTQNDTLLSCYLANDLEMSENWSLRLAAGYAERPPTLLERYADGIFLGVTQSGYSRVIGTPTLLPEENWQMDIALTGKGDNWRGRAAAFYSWVDDPVVFIGFPVNDPTGARLLRYINGELVTRTGFELRGEFDLTSRLSTFGNVRYLSGRDHDVAIDGEDPYDYALTGIYPLEGRTGVRLHDAEGGSTWGVEFGVRMVRAQDSVGILRVGFVDITDIDHTFEQPTPGFTITSIRSYYNVTENLFFVCGVENLFDRTYLEHLNLRLPQDTINGEPFADVAVQSPGITPYFGVECEY